MGPTYMGQLPLAFVPPEWYWPIVHNAFVILDNFIISNYPLYEQRYSAYLENDTSTTGWVIKIPHDVLDN